MNAFIQKKKKGFCTCIRVCICECTHAYCILSILKTSIFFILQSGMNLHQKLRYQNYVIFMVKCEFHVGKIGIFVTINFIKVVFF